MDVKIKQRLIGALVLGALAVIFVPMIVIGPETKGAADAARVPITVPDAPEGDFVTREIALGAPLVLAPTPDGVVPPVPDDPNALATVDATATIAPRVDALALDPQVAVDAASGLPMPAPTPAPPVATLAAGDYSVTAGAFSTRANADALVARLQSSGLPAYTEAVQVNGQPATRVKVGPFADRAAAEAARVRAASISGSAAVVTGDAASPPAVGAAATAAPAVAPAAAAVAAARASGFAVQLGAFARQDEAQALVTRARAAGFAAFEQRAPTASGVLWRVRLGPAADRAAAERMQSEAAAKLGISGIVVAHP